MNGDPVIPPPLEDDDDDVAWALQTAAVQWERGAFDEAVVWVRRAVDAAIAAGSASRIKELNRLVEVVKERAQAAAADSVDETEEFEEIEEIDELDELDDAGAMPREIPIDFDDNAAPGSFPVPHKSSVRPPPPPRARPPRPPSASAPAGPSSSVPPRPAPSVPPRPAPSVPPRPASSMPPRPASSSPAGMSSAPPPPSIQERAKDGLEDPADSIRRSLMESAPPPPLADDEGEIPSSLPSIPNANLTDELTAEMPSAGDVLPRQPGEPSSLPPPDSENVTTEMPVTGAGISDLIDSAIASEPSVAADLGSSPVSTDLDFEDEEVDAHAEASPPSIDASGEVAGEAAAEDAPESLPPLPPEADEAAPDLPEEEAAEPPAEQAPPASEAALASSDSESAPGIDLAADSVPPESEPVDSEPPPLSEPEGTAEDAGRASEVGALESEPSVEPEAPREPEGGAAEPAPSTGSEADGEPEAAEESEPTSESAPPSDEEPERAVIETVFLDEVRGFEDLPEEQQAELARIADLQPLSMEEEVGSFGAALVVRGAVGIMPAIADVAASIARPGDVVFTTGSLEDGIVLRVVALEDETLVASWKKETLDAAFAACPWVVDELREVADRFQALAGATLGDLGDRLDDSLRAAVTDRLEVRVLEAGDVIVEKGAAVPGLHVVGGGRLEVLDGDEVVDELGPGDFVFPSEVTRAGAAPWSVRAGKGGALVLFASRSDAHELMLSVPPLLEILAG